MRGLVFRWYVIFIDTGHIATKFWSGPRWSPAFKIQPVLFPPSGKPADWEDVRLISQSNHLIVVRWQSSFIESERERSNEELKSKGRTERERQWGSKRKRVFSLEQQLQEGSALKGMCWVSSIQLLSSWTRHFTLLSGRGVKILLGRLLCMIVITKATKSKVKETVPAWSRSGFLSTASAQGTWPTMDRSEILRHCKIRLARYTERVNL